MRFKIGNKDTNNFLEYNITENVIIFKNEFEMFRAKGTFSKNKLILFENKIKKIISKELIKDLLGESDSHTSSREIFTKIMQNEKITHITYKEMNPFTEEDFSKDMFLEIMEAPYYNKLNSITIETVYKKIHCKIRNNEY